MGTLSWSNCANDQLLCTWLYVGQVNLVQILCENRRLQRKIARSPPECLCLSNCGFWANKTTLRKDFLFLKKLKQTAKERSQMVNTLIVNFDL